MRIISKFNDYYDSAMAYGQDKSLVFNRELIKVPHAEFDIYYQRYVGQRHPLDLPYGLSLKSYSRKTIDPEFPQVHLSDFVIAFCGKLYPGVRVRFEASGPRRSKDKFEYFYDSKTFKDFTDSYVDHSEKVRYWVSNLDKSFEKLNGTDHNVHDLHIEHGVSIISYDALDFVKLYDNDPHFKINPCLKDYQFYKVMDPYTAFQELSMWIGGVLPRPNKLTVNISDKHLAASKGFNELSFKKAPTKRR